MRNVIVKLRKIIVGCLVVKLGLRGTLTAQTGAKVEQYWWLLWEWVHQWADGISCRISGCYHTLPSQPPTSIWSLPNTQHLPKYPSPQITLLAQSGPDNNPQTLNGCPFVLHLRILLNLSIEQLPESSPFHRRGLPDLGGKSSDNFSPISHISVASAARQ